MRPIPLELQARSLAISETVDGHRKHNAYDLEVLPFSANRIFRIRRDMETLNTGHHRHETTPPKDFR